MSWVVLSPLIITITAWAIIALERLYPYDRGQRLFRTGWFTDFFWYTLVQSYLLGLVIAALVSWIDRATGASRLGLVTSWPTGAQIGFFLITHDLYIYWFHRLQHKSPLLWRIHEAHHSAKDVDWVAGSRSHAVEILINQSIEYLPIVLLGAPPEMLLIKGTLDAVWGMYIHSNIDVKSGWLQKVVNGPEMHRWHHSVVYSGDGVNFSTKLAIWDWLFGTAHLPAEKPSGYGVGDDYPQPTGAWRELTGYNYAVQLAFAFRPLSAPDISVNEQPLPGQGG